MRVQLEKEVVIRAKIAALLADTTPAISLFRAALEGKPSALAPHVTDVLPVIYKVGVLQNSKNLVREKKIGEKCRKMEKEGGKKEVQSGKMLRKIWANMGKEG